MEGEVQGKGRPGPRPEGAAKPRKWLGEAGRVQWRELGRETVKGQWE